jgi:nitroimidazol reductase NimA-like FMN-containing flavoprotein (pyridoxamine 5'-phosphate oxidase superfamily)
MAEKFPGNDVEGLRRLVRQVPVGHLAFVDKGNPRVLPIAIAAQDDDPPTILLHGSTGSHWLRLVATGIPVSLAVTAVDGLVVARSAFESSIHYRSAVMFGSCTPVIPEAREAVLELLTDALIPGRVAEIRRPHQRELAATLVLRMTIEEWSWKVSDGWPDDPADDVAGPGWCTSGDGSLRASARFARSGKRYRDSALGGKASRL